MTVIEGTRAHLLALTAISTLVGGARIYPLRLPQKPQLAAIVLLLVDDPEMGQHLRGTGGLFTARIQLDSWAATRDAAVDLGLLCRQRINGFQGTWIGAGSPAPHIRVQYARYDDGSERFEEDILGGLCRHQSEYLITYRRSEEQMLAFT